MRIDPPKNDAESARRPGFFVVAAAACGLAVGVGFASAGAQTVDFWTTDTEEDRLLVIANLLERFERANPGVTVTLTPVEENELPTAATMASVIGGLPALVHTGSAQNVAFGEQGLIDVDGTAAVLDRIGTDRFFDGALAMHRSVDDSVYAVPFYGWVQGIWYRADWFEAAGLAPPTDWDAILDAATALHAPEEGRYGILVGSQADAYAEQVFTHFALSNGARQFDPDGDIVFDSPETLETLEYYLKLVELGPPGPQTWRARDYFLQGRLAMMVYSTFIMDDLALAEVAAGSLTGDNFEGLDGAEFDADLVDRTGMVPVISNREPAGYGVMTSLALLNAEPEVAQAAQDLAVFLMQEENYIAWLHTAPGGMNPILDDIAGSPAFLDDPMGLFRRYGSERLMDILDGLEEIQAFGLAEGRVFPAAGEIFTRQIIPQMIDRAAWDGVPPAEAVAWADAEMRAIVAP